jgi:hypothetical protein
MFRSRILPAIFAIWGALIVLRALFFDLSGEGSFQTGYYVGVAFGVVFFVAGVRALMKPRTA